MKPGRDVLLLGIGPILNEALVARAKLEREWLSLGVASMGSIKPLDIQFLKKYISEGYTKWISLEEHHKIGGLGSDLLEWLSDNNINNVKLKRMGIDDHFIHQIGNQDYAREAEGLNWKGIKQNVETTWN